MSRVLMFGVCAAAVLALAGTAAADSATYQIAASADDTRADSSNTYYNFASVYWPCSSASTMGYLRWAIDIPAGATIDSAYLEVYVTSTYSTASTVQMQLLDYDNCPAFSSNPFTWSVTGSPVSWTQSSWTANSWNSSATDSADLKTIVQAFIDRGGYSTGNYLGLRGVWTSGALRYIRAWDDSLTPLHTYGAKLVVTYSTNQPPVADAGENQNVTDTDDSGYETVTLDGTGSSDSDGTIVSYVWKEGVTQIATGSTAEVSLTVGTHTITLVVTDDDSDTDDDTVEIVVSEPEETEVTYQVAASADDTRADSSNNYYTYASVYWPCSSASTMGFLRWAIDIPAGATIQSAYLQVYVTSTYSSASTVQMQLLDYDNCPAFSSNPYSWSVTGPTVNWAESSWTANNWYSSSTDSVDLKTIVQAFIDRGGYSSGNYLGLRGMWISGAARYIRAWDDSLTPLHTYGAKLVVTYTSGGAPNDPPVAEAGSNQNVTDTDDGGYETVTLDGTGSSDSDGTIVSYIWKEGVTQIATGSTASVSLAVGTHTITLVVTDDDSDTDDDTCQIVVNPAPSNDPPVADAGSNQNVTDTDDNGYETVTLDGTGSSDSDGTIVSYVWKEGASQIATGSTANVSLSVGTHTITLVVTDDDSDTDDDICQVVVNEYTGPSEETYQVAASTDDTRADSSTNYVSWGNLVWPASSSAMRSYIRWAIDVPYGATIESAYVQVYTTSTYSAAGTVQMQLLDYDNCPDFSSNPFSWSVVGDTVNWTLGSWTANNWYTSEDVTDIVQGFVDRAGYAPGNYLGLRAAWVSGSQRYIRSFDDTPGHTTGAKLVVTYSGGDAGPATYYIDFDGGNDANDGRSPADAWQHCPGDPEATGVPVARETLWPGDTLLFKGGVVYRGTVVCNWAGSEAAPIIYDGNSEGTYGTGKAVIDGSEEITGWTQCTSSGDAEGNSNWANLWYNYLPAGTSALGCNIYEDDTMCPPAQDPNPPDAAFPDCIGGVSTPNYYYIPYTNLTKTSVTDPTNLNRGGDSTYWHDAIIAAHYVPNVVYTMTIQSYNTSTGTVSFNDSNNGTCYTDSNQSCYSILNSLHVLDQSGEVFFRTTPEGNGTHKVWFWSPSGSPNSHTVTYSTRTAGFQVASGSDYLVIQNFIVQKQTGDTGASEAMGLRATDGSVSHLAILDCEFRRVRFDNIDSNAYRGNGAVTIQSASDVVFDGNTITETPFLGGMVMGDGDDITITNNYLYRCGNKPIWWPACDATGVTLMYNVVDYNLGCHSTGISLFGGNVGYPLSEAVVAYNIVTRSGNSFTYSNAEDLTVAYNYFDSSTPHDLFTVQENGAYSSDIYFYNNTMIRGSDAPTMTILAGATMKNNIFYTFQGSASLTPDANSNLYLKHAWDTTVFADPGNGDYHLASGSPARDAGLDLGYEEDLDGVEVPQNDDPDIGCYEYAP